MSKRGFEKNSKKIKVVVDSQGNKHKMYGNIASKTKNGRCDMEFESHIDKMNIIPCKSCGFHDVDVRNSKEYTKKTYGVDDSWFEDKVLHHGTKKRIMWVDKVLHQKTPHIGGRKQADLEQRKELGLI